jgi:3-phenylpropionate/trans-cinnamate dioxygenase ferredoxin component
MICMIPRRLIMARYVRVASVSELIEDEGLCVEVEGMRIALFKTGDDIFAVGDMCTHQEGPLSEGIVWNGQVACPWHGARFDLKTGRCMGPPADEEVPSYPVRVTGDDVEIEV